MLAVPVERVKPCDYERCQVGDDVLYVYKKQQIINQGGQQRVDAAHQAEFYKLIIFNE
jgi:hypothetical protein